MKIIISGGGTGGHIFPAIAIANTLKARQPDVEILFIGAKGRMEMEKVPAAGYAIKGLWISGLQRRLTIKNLLFPFKVLSSLWNAKKIIKQFKPDVVIGVGGYASGPTLKMAAALNIPTLIQEQNSFPGITNKLLANKTNIICVAYDGMDKFFPASKIVFTGNPVRKEVIELSGKKTQALEFFKLSENKKVVLVVGGSLGALTINDSINRHLQRFADQNIQLIWQTGKSYYPKAKDDANTFADAGIRVYDFIREMDFAYAAADVVISRAGAIAISELCAVNKPIILVPSPNVSEDHQTKNAMALVEKNAALMVTDIDAKEKLVDTALSLLANETKCYELSQNIKTLARPNAANLIVDEILKLVK